MIEINLVKQRKSPKSRAFALLFAAVAVLAIVSGFAPEFGGPAKENIPIRTENKVVFRKTPLPSPGMETSSKRKKSAESASLKIRGFVNFTDRKYAMLVSGRSVRWVEEGDKAFGMTMTNIGEDGAFAETVSETDKKVFFPLEK